MKDLYVRNIVKYLDNRYDVIAYEEHADYIMVLAQDCDEIHIVSGVVVDKFTDNVMIEQEGHEEFMCFIADEHPELLELVAESCSIHLDELQLRVAGKGALIRLQHNCFEK